MIIRQSEQIMKEVGKVLIGKEQVIEKVLMAIYAGGHILLEDTPGVGKTTLALGFSRALGMDYKRIQFTPDTMPSDITGYTVPGQGDGGLVYRPGAVHTNLFLGDEINRTSPKTQSALLEAMEEGNVTVDGVTYLLPKPFICIATQNPVGMSGTQPLPEAQLDRFMVRLSIGYPSTEDQIRILDEKRSQNTMDEVQAVVTRDMVLEVQNYLSTIRMTEDILRYITVLCERTREDDGVELGVSPRGIIALSRMARAKALLGERDYVVPEDVRAVFRDVCAHRVILRPQARMEGRTVAGLLEDIMQSVSVPGMPGKKNR
ncbi:MAG: MoxR family ATPase [Lachnospiraceae bacterium]|nr:MoxR family ATPase [Lachnospiraceae bacterium]